MPVILMISASECCTDDPDYGVSADEEYYRLYNNSSSTLSLIFSASMGVESFRYVNFFPYTVLIYIIYSYFYCLRVKVMSNSNESP